MASIPLVDVISPSAVTFGFARGGSRGDRRL
jgi:hypothetical protein